jgi:hypothetical protein
VSCKALWHALLSALLQSAFEPIVRDACFADCWARSQPKRGHKINPKTCVIAGKWISITLRAHWKTESVGLTELGSEDSFSGAEKRKSLLTLTAEQQIPP